MEPRAPVRPPAAVESEPPVADDDAIESGEGGSGPDLPDLSALPIAGITRRRLAFLLAALCSVWIVIVFARQVGDASAAAARLEALRAQNAALTAELGALEAEYRLIQDDAWVVQQGHGHRLGRPGEIAVTRGRPLDLPPNAPGSAALRLGAPVDSPSPLESWLSLLFGPSR